MKILNFYKFIANSKTKNDMEKFWEVFDPIELKYSPSYHSSHCTKQPGAAGRSTQLFRLPLNIRSMICEFENNYKYASLNKKKYSYIDENLQLIYGDSDLVLSDIKNYHHIEKKFIQNYLAIPQLDMMFNEDYFNFEWDMFVGQNFKEHRNDYNRDHFIHQIRNLYMMLVLLGEFGFYEATYKILESGNKAKISEYTSKKLKQFMANKHSSQIDLLNNIKEKIKEEKRNVNTIYHIPAEIWDIFKDENEYKKIYFLKYVIYASSILSALFHDMGYPICHFLEIRHRVSEYNPTMYMFTHNSADTFDKIASVLNDSLLFTIVSSHEIKHSLELSNNGRYNHGSYSAIAFLMQFYSNGVIYTLSEEKQCAIELAAVAIYNHTANFAIVSNNAASNYYQPVFRQNPISFLLRFCDDLQEWDRRYFEFSKDSDLSICEKCLTPMLPFIKKVKPEDEDKLESENKPKIIWYNCLCGGSELFRYDSFLKRKLYVVRVADSVTANVLREKGDLLKISIKYDLYKLLKMARINNTYAKYRLNELKDLKIIIGKQNFKNQSDDVLKFDYIYIKYFISANPILIKIKILENYFTKIENMNKDNYQQVIKALKLDEVFNKAFTKESNYIESEIQNSEFKLYEYLDSGIFEFYKDLLLDCLARKWPQINGDEENNNTDDLCKTQKNLKYINIQNVDDFYQKVVNVLIEDCISQYEKELEDDQIYNLFLTEEDQWRKQYLTQYMPDENKEDLLYSCVAAFCNKDNYFNKYKNVSQNNILNYYTDLHFFHMLNEYL